MFERLKKKWDSFWESEAKKLDEAIGEIYVKEFKKQNKDFFEEIEKYH